MSFLSMVTFAVTRIPQTGQLLLARRGSRQVRAALAASTLTDTSVVDQLVSDRLPDVRKFAYARTNDLDRLASVLAQRPGVCAPFAARNPLAPPAVLAHALNSPHRGVALNAWCNPSTPDAARRTLTPERARELCEVGGSNHDHVVRAYELVAANPWMADQPARWCGAVRRALCGAPATSKATLEQIRKTGRHGVTTLKRHPVLHPEASTKPLADWSLTELALWGSPATDLLAAEHPLLDPAFAAAMLHPSIEPHVLGRLVNRFGPVTLLAGADRPHSVHLDWSGTRFKAAMWVAPVLGFVHSNALASRSDVTQAAELLGEDATAWETFLSLLDNWHGSFVSAATTAITL
jgi:hypothetical protein